MSDDIAKTAATQDERMTDTASPTTVAFRGLPADIQAASLDAVGQLPRPMSHMEMLLAVGQAILAERERDKWGLEWRPVVGWEDHYEVSNTGRIRKMDGTPLTQWANGDGYMLVRLSNPRGKIRVHRAVAEAFIPNPNSLPFVNHVDNDRAHNCDFNLEWCTQKENLDHSRKQGRMPDNYWVGKRSPNASLTDDIVLEIRQLYASGAHSYQALAEKFGISKRAIGRLINRESYADV